MINTLTIPTAVEMVDAGRKAADTYISYLSNKEMKDAVKIMFTAQLSIAETVAEKYDEAVKQSTEYFRKMFNFTK